jgi:phosphoenolpyruvate---glycerone phosphotransferase subunit DhaL
MTGDELRALLGRVLPDLAESREELRDLDAAIGDGDLGITVAEGAAAAVTALDALPTGATPAEVIRAVGPAVARANPSTFAALIAGALLAAAREVSDAEAIGTREAILIGRTAAAAIAARGKSAVGDKTILDALVPSLDAAEGDPSDPLRDALAAARAGLEATRDMTSRRGRASWIGERTRGHLDPGAAAYVRFLEAVSAAVPAREPIPAIGNPTHDSEET